MKNKMNMFWKGKKIVVSYYKSCVLIGIVIEKKREIVIEVIDVFEFVGIKILRLSCEMKIKMKLIVLELLFFIL